MQSGLANWQTKRFTEMDRNEQYLATSNVIRNCLKFCDFFKTGNLTLLRVSHQVKTISFFRAFEQLVKDYSISTFYLSNPNNPTTTLFDKQMLLDLIRRYPNILFVLDETYLMFAADYWERTLTKEATSLANLVVITSMSKIFSLPGLRLGFSVSNPSYMERFRNMIIPYGVPHLSQLYVSWLIEQDDFLSVARNRYAAQSVGFRELIQNQLSKNATIYASSAPYFLIKIHQNNIKDQSLSAFLKDKKIMVRCGGEFESLDDSWLRVSVRDAASNDELVKNIDAFLKND